ncbi:MAG: PE-PPE domain-containing protein, partial [Candidatus Nanopelagicales bacterium]
MSACRYVGRVGGLAIALGVGAAIYSGAAVASADTPSSTGSVSAGPASGRTSHSTPARAQAGRTSKPAAAQVSRRAAAAPAAVSVSVRPSAAATGGDVPATTDTPVDQLALAYSRRATVTAAKVPAAASMTTQPEIMGPSGVPVPSEDYVNTAVYYYIHGGDPQGPPAPQVIFTPEGLYPITGVKSLPLNTSVDQGIEILTRTLALLPENTETTVFGYSQSAIIAGLLQSGYPLPPNGAQYTVPSNIADTVDFVLVGNELNPDGGFLSRFTATDYTPALDLPSLGIPFYEATPADAFPTTNYTLEYDGFADFPRYPLNFLADLNA